MTTLWLTFFVFDWYHGEHASPWQPLPVLHSRAVVVVPVHLGILLRWLGMIVVVPDGNPVQTLLQQDCFIAWDLQDLWDDSVEKAVGIIGTVHPDLCLAKYSCLRSSDSWMDDGIIG